MVIYRYTQRRRTAGLPLGYAREQTLATTRAGVTVEPNTDLQVLEDERIALYIQNEEFLRELRRNREFIDSLESGELHNIDCLICSQEVIQCYRQKAASAGPHVARLPFQESDVLLLLSVISYCLLFDLFRPTPDCYSATSYDKELHALALTAQRRSHVNR